LLPHFLSVDGDIRVGFKTQPYDPAGDPEHGDFDQSLEAVNASERPPIHRSSVTTPAWQNLRFL
jgi:hypothetical protein